MISLFVCICIDVFDKFVGCFLNLLQIFTMPLHIPFSRCTPPHLQDDLLVNGELGDDVGQKQVAAVFTGGVHAGFGQQARPGKGHEAPQLAVARLVVVVDVVGGVLHQQGGELQQADSQ